MKMVANPLGPPRISAVEVCLCRNHRRHKIMIWVLAAAVGLCSWMTDPSLAVGIQEDAKSRKAVEQALPYLAKESASWVAQRGCVSCHRVSFMIWSHNEAAARGFPVDRSQLDATTNWAFTSMLSDRSEFGGADTISQMLLGRDTKSVWRKKPPRHFKSSDPYETLFEILLERQRADGSWPPEGQLSTPAEISTGWALLALASFVDPAAVASEKLDPARDLTDELADQIQRSRQQQRECQLKGMAYLATVDPHPTHEGLLLRFMCSDLADLPVRTELHRQVLARQNVDGGWSNRFDQSESDAFATGQTLYALSVLRIPTDPTVIDKARKFLIGSQQPQGHWLVPADRIRDRARRASVDEIFSYWGTAWATIGLLQTLPENNASEK